MKVLVDMNLSPAWVPVLQQAGYEAVHWSQVGPSDAPDTVVMAWAWQQDCVVFTHDLDYSALLYATGATAPSVLQLRA